MENTFVIGGIILVAGIFGGLVNYFTIYTKKESGSKRKCLRTILAGVAASCLLPLFLSMISSDLIANTRIDDKYYFVFGGLCLVAAIFSGDFINTISKRVLEQVKKTNEKVDKAEGKSDHQEFIIKDFTEELDEFVINNFVKLNNKEDENRKIQ